MERTKIRRQLAVLEGLAADWAGEVRIWVFGSLHASPHFAYSSIYDCVRYEAEVKEFRALIIRCERQRNGCYKLTNFGRVLVRERSTDFRDQIISGCKWFLAGQCNRPLTLSKAFYSLKARSGPGS
jgi:hypothetical protein